MALAEIIFGQVFDKVLETVKKPSVPVSSGAEKAVAQAVAEKIAPIVVNASNAEPWFRSRVFIGLITAGVGYVGSKAGLVTGEGDVTQIIDIIASIVQAGGLAYAWYGRVVGASKKPLGA